MVIKLTIDDITAVLDQLENSNSSFKLVFDKSSFKFTLSMHKPQPKFSRLRIPTRSMSKPDQAEKSSVMFEDGASVTGSKTLSEVPKSSKSVNTNLSTKTNCSSKSFRLVQACEAQLICPRLI